MGATGSSVNFQRAICLNTLFSYIIHLSSGQNGILLLSYKGGQNNVSMQSVCISICAVLMATGVLIYIDK